MLLMMCLSMAVDNLSWDAEGESGMRVEGKRNSPFDRCEDGGVHQEGVGLEKASVVVVEVVEVEESETVFFDEFVKECSGSGLIFVVWFEHDFAEDAADGASFHGFRGAAEGG